ncbi:MAG: polysaccharide deacetylase family protein [Chloroflexota bacterium]
MRRASRSRSAIGTFRRRIPAAATVLLAALVLVPSAPAAAHIPVVNDLDTSRKVIALTIDDGYSPETCLRMARILREKGADATFFPIGKRVRAYPSVWRRIGRDFPLANHTMYHAILPPLSEEQIRRQIGRQLAIVRKVAPDARMAEFRPPGGAWSDTVRRVAASFGYRRILLWDVTNADTSLNGTARGMLRRAMAGGPGSVLLMHCNRPISAEILPQIIDGYRARGFTFVTTTELFGDGSAGGSRTPNPPPTGRPGAERPL